MVSRNSAVPAGSIRAVSRLLIFAASVGLMASAAPAAEPGSARSFVFAEVQAVFDASGEEGVKDWMRAMVKRSKKAGRKIPSTGKKPKCGSCHESLKSYSLSPGAVEDLRGLLSPDPSALSLEAR